MRTISREAERTTSDADRVRVGVVLTLLLLLVGVASFGFAVFSGLPSWWALAGFSLVAGGLVGWRSQRERRVIRKTNPGHDVTAPEIGKLASVAAGVVVLTLVVRGLAALLS